MVWKLPERDEELLALAKGYPYEAPQASYLYRDGGVLGIESADFGGRTPVIGHGSNRAPSQIRRKYGHLSGRASEIPVTLAWLRDYDIVYSAHVTRYGAIASTLHPAPGCRVRIAVTWLDAEQLAYMHRTEGFYSYGSLRGAEIALEQGPSRALAEAFVYRGDQGCLLKEGKPIGLAAASGEGRPHPVMTQDAILAEVHRRYGDGSPLESGILATIRDPQRRRALLEAMSHEALHEDWPHFSPSHLGGS
jgi:hypothetical protein